MAAIDPLLGIVETKRAIGLVLASGDVPKLLPMGARSALTMPPLSTMMMEHLLGELLTPAQRATLTERGSIECTFESSAYGPYAIRGQREGDKLTLTLTKGARAATSEPRAQPATSAVTAPAPPARGVDASVTPAMAMPARSVVEPTTPASAPVARDATVNPVLRARVTDALERAMARRASDILFSADAPPLVRVDGILIESHDALPFSNEEILAYFGAGIAPRQMEAFERTGSVDFALQHAPGSARLRGNLFRHSDGVAVALRPIHADIPSLAELHLPASLTQIVEARHGLVLFTGSTGAGKSTTLAALLEHINRTRAAHIVTLEDPIEYSYQRRRSVIHQREIGQHVDSFASGLRAALRENPDVLLVGEMRDAETIRMALTAAQTGHLVLSTLHSGGAIMAIDRVIDAFPEGEKDNVRQELAASLRHVVTQQLVPMTEGGRVPALEILTVNHAVASMIRDGRTHMIATPLETGAEEGMVPMARSLAALVRSGRVARTVAMAMASDRAALEKQLEDRGPRTR